MDRHNVTKVPKTTQESAKGGTYCSLCSYMGAAYDLGAGQWLFTLGSLPQGDQGRHICKADKRRRVKCEFKLMMSNSVK